MGGGGGVRVLSTVVITLLPLSCRSFYDMYRLKDTEGARRPPRARQRHRTTRPHAIYQKAFQKEPHEPDSQYNLRDPILDTGKDTGGEPKRTCVLVLLVIINP